MSGKAKSKRKGPIPPIPVSPFLTLSPLLTAPIPSASLFPCAYAPTPLLYRFLQGGVSSGRSSHFTFSREKRTGDPLASRMAQARALRPRTHHLLDGAKRRVCGMLYRSISRYFHLRPPPPASLPLYLSVFALIYISQSMYPRPSLSFALSISASIANTSNVYPLPCSVSPQTDPDIHLTVSFHTFPLARSRLTSSQS